MQHFMKSCTRRQVSKDTIGSAAPPPGLPGQHLTTPLSTPSYVCGQFLPPTHPAYSTGATTTSRFPLPYILFLLSLCLVEDNAMATTRTGIVLVMVDSSFRRRRSYSRSCLYALGQGYPPCFYRGVALLYYHAAGKNDQHPKTFGRKYHQTKRLRYACNTSTLLQRTRQALLDHNSGL